MAFNGKSLNVESSDLMEGLFDYILNHVLTTIIMVIIILILLWMIINICRAERRHKRRLSSTIDTAELKGEIIVDSKD